MSVSRRTLGQSGPEMSVIGPGSMRMSDLYGPADDAESVATLHAAIDAGVNLIDTGDFYGSGANEMLIGRALRNRRREDVVVSVKFGSRRSPDGAFQSAPYDVSPAAVKDRLTYSLRRLGTDYLDIHRPARLNPQIPIEETVGALKEMRQASHIRHTGLSEVGAETIRRAADQRSADRVLTAVPGPERVILPTLRELGIGMTAYGVPSRGMLSGRWSASRRLVGGDFRAHSPQFQGENPEANLSHVEALGRVARRLNVTTGQVAIAWVAAQGSDIIPLVGARHQDRLTESLGAASLPLHARTLREIEATRRARPDRARARPQRRARPYRRARQPVSATCPHDGHPRL